jgi:hypothetical protein
MLVTIFILLEFHRSHQMKMGQSYKKRSKNDQIYNSRLEKR